MTHAKAGTLQSYLDGQLTGPEATAVEVHLAECELCREAFVDMRSLAAEVSEALNLLTSVVPLARARLRTQHLAVRPEVRRRWSFATGGVLKAAAIVLLVAGAASAAIPGSPVRRWASALLDRIQGDDVAEAVATESTPAPVPAVEPQETVGSDFLLPVEGGRVRVSLHSPAADVRVVVRLVEDAEGWVRSVSASEEPRYQTGAGYVDVFGVRSGLIIGIPRSLRSAVVDVDGRVFWEKSGDEVRVSESNVQEIGGEFVFRGRS